jgi:hypothetical protein
MSDTVYYRIFLNRDNLLVVVELQAFDEHDYDQNKFYRDNYGYKMSWPNELEAIKFLNENFKYQFIHPDYVTPNNTDFWKEMEK